MHLLPTIKPTGEDNVDALLTKIAVMLYEMTNEGKVVPTSGPVGGATEATQEAILGSVDGVETALATTNSTLANLYSKSPTELAVDAGGRSRVSSITTLFDGKTLNVDNTLIFDNVGTGTGTWGANKYHMSVTPGQYFIRSAKRYSPYFSGKSQLVECTMDNFQFQAGIVKRFGYFSSSTTAPYTATLDGFFIENDGAKLALKAYRAGTETINVPWTQWSGYNAIKDVNFENFNVWAFDFLWLGGAILRVFLKTNAGFVLVHTFHHAGNAKDLFILSPDQPIRYEIRSTSGTGDFRYICSQVATEGSINEEGYNGSVHTGSTLITCAAIGTTYPIKAIRKKLAYRDISVKLTGINMLCATANDQLLWTLQLNPTLSSALTFADGTMTSVEQATGNGTITVTTPGRILASGYMATGMEIPPALFEKDYLTYLGCNLDGNPEPLVLCATPITTSVGIAAAIEYKENTN